MIAAFAIYVILARRLPVTQNLVITGTPARNFGLTLLITMFPLSALIGAVLGVVLPRSLREWPVPQALHGVFFGAIVLAIAWAFRDRT